MALHGTADEPSGVRGSRLPAALPPFLQVGALGAQGGVVAVTGVDPGLVGEGVEELGGDVGEERGEGRGVVEGVADAAGEEAGVSAVK